MSCWVRGCCCWLITTCSQSLAAYLPTLCLTDSRNNNFYTSCLILTCSAASVLLSHTSFCSSYCHAASLLPVAGLTKGCSWFWTFRAWMRNAYNFQAASPAERVAGRRPASSKSTGHSPIWCLASVKHATIRLSTSTMLWYAA